MNVYLIRAVGTGGARGARAPPIFLRERTKIRLESSLFPSIVHPLILAGCYDPVLATNNGDLQVLSFKTFEVTIHWLSKVCLFSETLRITGSKCPKLCLSLTSKAAEEKNVRALGSVQSID